MKMGIVLQRDFREICRTNAFRILVIVSAVITIGASAGVSAALGRQPWLGEETARPLLDMIIGLITYFMPLLVLMAFIWAFASLPVTKEKVSGNIECLLATPIGPKMLWMGKSLAIFLPGLVIAILATLVVMLVVNFSTIAPATGNLVLPAPSLFVGFIVNPMLFFALLSFIILFSLANNPDIAIAPSFLLGFGLMIGMPLGLATGAVKLDSWSFALWYLVGTVILWIVVGYVSRVLTKENIVLSSKGD